MNIKDFLFVLGLASFVVISTAMSHYKQKADKLNDALINLQTAYDEDQKMLRRYERQFAKLTQDLTAANTQAETRKQLLQEVLAKNEENQTWRDTPVPSGVIRLFEQRKQNGTNQTGLPTNDRVQKH